MHNLGQHLFNKMFFIFLSVSKHITFNYKINNRLFNLINAFPYSWELSNHRMII